MIATRALGKSYLDPSELPLMLSREEDLRRQIYDDGVNHIPTIGYGLNLQVPTNLSLMLDNLGVYAASDAFYAAHPGATTETTSQRYYRINTTFRALFNAFPLSTTGNLALL